MKQSRRTRLATALLALISVLFVQLAVAAYACPSRQIVQAEQDAAMAMQGHEHMEGCEGMAGGTVDTALCHAHCQPDTQSLDKPDLPDVSPFVAIALLSIIADSTILLQQVYPPREPLFLRRITSPPLSIRNCCFRI